jgi:hypothetical protein
MTQLEYLKIEYKKLGIYNDNKKLFYNKSLDLLLSKLLWKTKNRDILEKYYNL